VVTRDVDIRVDGLREFRRDLKRLDNEADKELQRGIRDGAQKVLTAARAAVPRQSGALARSLKISVTARKASIYSNLPYAPVVHWGGEIKPRGVPIRFPRTEFASKAAEQGADQLVEDIADGVERAARRTGWH
jgi:phage gpG-like protein